jgi:sigma-E factor negative regulatory protein RseA
MVETQNMVTGTKNGPGGDVVALEDASAVFDGELDLQSEVEHHPEHLSQWSTYGLIGDAMRDPALLKPVSAAFSVRLSAALAREPVHQVNQPVDQAVKVKPRSWSNWFAWPSLAVAAAVVSVVWVAQPLLAPEDAASPALVLTESAELDPAVINDYMDAHRQLSGPIAVRQASHLPGAER